MGFLSELLGVGEKPEYEKMLDAKREGRLDEYNAEANRKEKAEIRRELENRFNDESFTEEVMSILGEEKGLFDWFKLCIADSTCDREYILRLASYYSEKKLDNADLNMNVPSGTPREIIKKILVAQFGIDVVFVDEAMKIMNDDVSDSMLEETTSELIKGDYVTKGYALDIIYMFLGDFMK